MFDDDALRPSSGPGGVDNVCRVVAVNLEKSHVAPVRVFQLSDTIFVYWHHSLDMRCISVLVGRRTEQDACL